MFKTKHINLITLSSIFALSLCSCQSKKIFCTPLDCYKYTYGNLDEDTFPISGWVAPTARWNSNTEEQYKYLKESGLTSIFALYEQFIDGEDNSEIYKALENAEKYGVNYLVRDATLWHVDGEDFKNRYESRGYKNYSSFAGFLYTDEPREERFYEIKTSYDKFRTYIGGNKLFYVNMNPHFIYGEDYARYEQYLDEFQTTVGLPFLSYDYYAPYGDFPFVRPTYFNQLDLVAKFSSKNKIPFWAFALSSAHKFVSSGDYYRCPTETDIYWQVNTALAYGAKGLTYFCYQVPNGTEQSEIFVGQGGNFIDEKGQKTEVYYYGQKINNFIHSIDHILMNSTLVTMLKHETGNVGANLVGDFSDSSREITSLVSNDDILVSVNVCNGTTTCYCVNTSLTNQSTFTLNFTNKFKFNLYQMDHDNDQIKAKEITRTLNPGDALMIELVTK